jgi:hypothetical protein
MIVIKIVGSTQEILSGFKNVFCVRSSALPTRVNPGFSFQTSASPIERQLLTLATYLGHQPERFLNHQILSLSQPSVFISVCGHIARGASCGGAAMSVVSGELRYDETLVLASAAHQTTAAVSATRR